jgi:hypothetical protein
MRKMREKAMSPRVKAHSDRIKTTSTTKRKKMVMVTLIRAEWERRATTIKKVKVIMATVVGSKYMRSPGNKGSFRLHRRA